MAQHRLPLPPLLGLLVHQRDLQLDDPVLIADDDVPLPAAGVDHRLKVGVQGQIQAGVKVEVPTGEIVPRDAHDVLVDGGDRCRVVDGLSNLPVVPPVGEQRKQLLHRLLRILLLHMPAEVLAELGAHEGPDLSGAGGTHRCLHPADRRPGLAVLIPQDLRQGQIPAEGAVAGPLPGPKLRVAHLAEHREGLPVQELVQELWKCQGGLRIEPPDARGAQQTLRGVGVFPDVIRPAGALIGPVELPVEVLAAEERMVSVLPQERLQIRLPSPPRGKDGPAAAKRLPEDPLLLPQEGEQLFTGGPAPLLPEGQEPLVERVVDLDGTPALLVPDMGREHVLRQRRIRQEIPGYPDVLVPDQPLDALRVSQVLQHEGLPLRGEIGAQPLDDGEKGPAVHRPVLQQQQQRHHRGGVEPPPACLIRRGEDPELEHLPQDDQVHIVDGQHGLQLIPPGGAPREGGAGLGDPALLVCEAQLHQIAGVVPGPGLHIHIQLVPVLLREAQLLPGLAAGQKCREAGPQLLQEPVVVPVLAQYVCRPLHRLLVEDELGHALRIAAPGGVGKLLPDLPQRLQIDPEGVEHVPAPAVGVHQIEDLFLPDLHGHPPPIQFVRMDIV